MTRNDYEYRIASETDIPFMKRMLYEAVYWRTPDTRPSFSDAMKIPSIAESLAGWGERPGDTGVIALEGRAAAGAAWFRYWKKEDSVRGFISDDISVLVIAVAEKHRRKGIARSLITKLAEYAAAGGVLASVLWLPETMWL